MAIRECNPTFRKRRQLAPKVNGRVQYQHNFYILKPLDLSKGNHKMLYERLEQRRPEP